MWRQAQKDPPEESCDTVAEKPETRWHRFLLCLHARTLKLSGEKSFYDVPLPRPSAKMVQRPDGPVQDGQQRVRQNFCPVEQLHPLPLIDTFRAWWFWRRHEVVRHVLSQVFAKFQGIFGKHRLKTERAHAATSLSPSGPIAPAGFLRTADGCSDSKVHGVCGSCDRDEAIELVTISLHPLPKKARGQRVCTYPVANHDME